MISFLAGLQYSINATDWLELRAKGGYSTGYKDWNYGGGATVEWLDSGNLDSNIGVDYTAETVTRQQSYIYRPYYTIIPNLLGNRGYFDYYRSEGYRIFSNWELNQPDFSFEFGFSTRNHASLPTTTAYDLLGKNNNFRINPPIQEGRLQSVDLVAGYNIDEGYNFGVTGQKKVQLATEHSSNELGSDFNFTRYTGRVSWSFPTFYQRRFLSNTLDINLQASTYSGDLPFQKLGSVDVALAGSAPFGVLKAANGRAYEGDQYIALNVEHNFRTVPFEAIGLTPAVERNLGIIVFGGVARSWLSDGTRQSLPTIYQPNLTDGIHWEAGASLNGILGLFRVDFAARLDEPAFFVNVSVARLF